MKLSFGGFKSSSKTRTHKISISQSYVAMVSSLEKKKSRQAQIEFPASVSNGQKIISGFGLSLNDVRKVLRKRSVFVIMKNIIIKTQLNLQISVSESNIISTAVLFKMAKRSDSTRQC